MHTIAFWLAGAAAALASLSLTAGTLGYPRLAIALGGAAAAIVAFATATQEIAKAAATALEKS